MEDYSIQPSLFDHSNLAEIAPHPDCPGERLVVSRNQLHTLATTQHRAFELLQIPLPLGFASARQVPT